MIALDKYIRRRPPGPVGFDIRVVVFDMFAMDENFHKYLTPQDTDPRWGLTVVNAGCAHIGPLEPYPVTGHPDHHHFTWNSWRVLQEYQVIYILNGRGYFESSRTSSTMTVEPGTIIFLFPGERHRYKPDPRTGWDEYWIGWTGEIADNLLRRGYLHEHHPCVPIGFREEVVRLYAGVIEQTRLERPGFQPLISGAVMHLIGTIYSAIRQPAVQPDVIDRAKRLFSAHLGDAYSPEQAARELNVSYSWFRKRFKTETGLSPGNYYLQLKIEQAREQLANTELPVKHIAYELNFESAFHFSRMFKQKTGMKPSEYRKLRRPDYNGEA